MMQEAPLRTPLQATDAASSRAQIEAQCTAIIDAHPHRAAIRETDLRLWVREVVAAHGEAAIWHATRAGGFGGSEIGVLVRNHAGSRADHQSSAHDIVEAKLLRRMPLEDSGPLRRGHENEVRHAQWFLNKHGAKRDQAGFERLASSTGLRTWMRYSPDEVALVPIDQPNPALGGARLARWLVDYKAPSVVDDSDEVKFQYVCQLHQGAMICAKQGLHLDGLMLSQFDWAGWQLKDDHIAYDPQIARSILAAGDHYWDYVLRAEVPAYVVKSRFEGEAELRQQWEQRANQIARLKALKKAVEDMLEPHEQALREHLGSMRLADTRCTVGDLSISAVQTVDLDAVCQAIAQQGSEAEAQTEAILASMAKKAANTSFDAKAMEAYLRSLGVSMKQFAKVKLDEAKVFEWAVANKLDPHALIKEQVRLTANKDLELRARDTVRAVFGMPEISNDEESQNDREGPETTGRSAPRSVLA